MLQNYVTELCYGILLQNCYRIMLQNYVTGLCYRIMLQNYVTELCYRSSVDPRDIARLEVLRQRKIPMTPLGIEPSAQFPIQLSTPCPHQYMYRH
jgi:hypothetical protein